MKRRHALLTALPWPIRSSWRTPVSAKKCNEAWPAALFIRAGSASGGSWRAIISTGYSRVICEASKCAVRRGWRTSLPDRFFAQLHGRSAAVTKLLFEAFNGTDVAPVVDLLQLVLLVIAVHFDDLEQLAARQQAAGQKHRAVEQQVVFEKHPSAVV